MINANNDFHPFLFPYPPMHIDALCLASKVDSVGEQCVRVGVVEVLRSGQAAQEVVAVAAEVRGTLDLAEMSSLVDHSGALFLAVASRRLDLKRGEEQVAVRHVVEAGDGISQDTIAAGTVHVGAVELCVSASGRAALLGDAGIDTRDGAASLGGGRLEVLNHLGVRARLSSQLGRLGKPCAAAESGVGCRQLVASAVALHYASLLGKGGFDLVGLHAIDFGLDRVGVEGNGANKSRRVLLGEGEGAGRQDPVRAARGKVVKLGNIELNLDGLARGNALKCCVGEGRHVQVDTDAVEGNGNGTVGRGGEHLGLLDRRRIKESTRLEDLEVILPVVRDDGLDLGVSLHLKLDTQSCWRPLVHGLPLEHRDGSGHRGESETCKQLHPGRIQKKNDC